MSGLPRISSHAKGFCFPLRAIPNAKRDQIVGLYGDALKLKVRQAPEAGKANQAIAKLLESSFGKGISARVIRGQSTQDKEVLVSGFESQSQLEAALKALLA